VLSEFTRKGLSSRIGRGRTDLVHQPLDPIIVAGPWVLAGGVVYSAIRALRRRRHA
jgi:hypothetical protein